MILPSLFIPGAILVLLPEAAAQSSTVKIGAVGLAHTHVHWILGREDRGDIEIVGIVEPNGQLAQRYAEQHGYSMELVFSLLRRC